MPDYSEIEFLYEPFSDEEIESIELIYRGYRVDYGHWYSWHDVARDIYDDLDDSIKAKVKDDVPPYYGYENYFIFALGFKTQVGQLWIDDIDREVRNLFYRLRAKLGEEKADKVLNLFKKYYIDECTLRRTDPETSEFDLRRAIPVKANLKKVKKHFDQDDTRIINDVIRSTATPNNYIWAEISDEELNGEGKNNPFQIIQDQYGEKISQTLISMIKKEIFAQFNTKKPLPEIVQDIKPLVKSTIPEALQEILFDSSWNLTCLVILPQYFNDHEKLIFDDRPFSGIRKWGVVSPENISNRLGAGGVRDLAQQGAEMPGGAGGNSPKQRAEFRQPKPPRNG